MNLLEVDGVSKSFGGLKALDRVSFVMGRGELLGLIGPNGSGKTTLLNVITGHYAPDSGGCVLEGTRLDGLRPHQVARMGVARMFQLTRLFGRMSVMENLLVAGLAVGLGLQEARRRAGQMMDRLGLGGLAEQDASALSGGQQKLLEFGCAFMGEPRLVILDEPFAAIHPWMREIMVEFIRERHAAGQTFLVVSHDIAAIAELCTRLVVMNHGTVLVDGGVGQVLGDDRVIEAYLGGPAI